MLLKLSLFACPIINTFVTYVVQWMIQIIVSSLTAPFIRYMMGENRISPKRGVATERLMNRHLGGHCSLGSLSFARAKYARPFYVCFSHASMLLKGLKNIHKRVFFYRRGEKETPWYFYYLRLLLF